MIGPGIHLMVDGITEMSFTARYLQQFLLDVVGMVGMQVIMGPFVHGQRSTWDGWVVLAESHAAIHIQGEACHVDLFSCQRFAVDVALGFIEYRLKLSHRNVEVIERIMPRVIHDRET